jgi:hypothetical protein
VRRTPTLRSPLAFNSSAPLRLRCCASSQVAGSILGKQRRETFGLCRRGKHRREASPREHPQSCGGRELAPRLFAGSIHKSNRGGLCITRQSTPTPKGVRSLRSRLFLGAGYFYVIHRRASRFVRSCASRGQRARFKRCVAGIGFNGRACGARRRLVAQWRSTGWPLSICGAAPLRNPSEASSGHIAGNIRVVPAWSASVVAKHPCANILNLAEAVSWRRACSQVASANRTGEAYA